MASLAGEAPALCQLPARAAMTERTSRITWYLLCAGTFAERAAEGMSLDRPERAKFE